MHFKHAQAEFLVPDAWLGEERGDTISGQHTTLSEATKVYTTQEPYTQAIVTA